MSPSPTDEVTLCLQQLEAGDGSAVHRLLPHIYEDLHKLAGQVFGARRQMTIQPTALVHEAYLRLVRQQNPGWQDRRHFLRVAAIAMRQLLIDYVRSRSSERRGGDQDEVLVGTQFGESDSEIENVDLIALHDALEKLRGLDERQAEIVELRFFSGLTVEEVADVLNMAERTVFRDWKMARSWFQRELGCASDE